MHDNLVKRLRADADYMDSNGIMLYAVAPFYRECADAIEELDRQRDRAYSRLCEWCAVCQQDRRNPEDCEIAALNPEPPKEEARITVTCTKCPCKGACDELPEDMSCEDVLAYYAI